MDLQQNENPYATPTAPAKEWDKKEYKKRPLATRWQRFAGHVIDQLIIGIVLVFAIMMILGGVYIVNPSWMDFEETPAVVLVESIIAVALISFCFLCVNGYLLAHHGQTLGKMIMRTRIVDQNDKLIPLPGVFFKRYFIFWVISMLPIVGSFLILFDALVIFRSSHNCLHDDLCGSKVVAIDERLIREPLPDRIEIPDM